MRNRWAGQEQNYTKRAEHRKIKHRHKDNKDTKNTNKNKQTQILTKTTQSSFNSLIKYKVKHVITL